MSFLSLLAIVLIVLKLVGLISISWFFVLVPLWILIIWRVLLISVILVGTFLKD